MASPSPHNRGCGELAGYALLLMITVVMVAGIVALDWR